MNEEHKHFMKKCLELALEAKRNGKAGVGALLVKDGQIIAQGIEGSSALPPQLAHAEIIAIIKGMSVLETNDLSGFTLYTTVEPCIMCSYMIRSTRIGHVVIGTPTTSVGGVTSNYPILTAEDIPNWPSVPSITMGFMEGECKNAS